jgi:transcriptional regulator of arginine metabolism
MNMPKTLQRHHEILRIIREESVSSQQEIVDLLARKGLAVTQPTLSRDLRELGVVKTPEGYLLPDELGGSLAHFAPRQSRQDRFESTVRDLVVSAVVSGTTVVLRTPPAEAQPVARAIDEADIPTVAGSIGGDDTIFVAMTSGKAARDFARRITSISSATSGRRRTHA